MVDQLFTDGGTHTHLILHHAAAAAVFPSFNPYFTKHDYPHLISIEIINFPKKKIIGQMVNVTSQRSSLIYCK